MRKITIDELKQEIERIGYYPTEELLYDTFNALYLFDEEETTPGQDIYAICLDGPPGAGKSSFAEAYTNLVRNILEEDIIFIEYQCDPTTGKEELYEEINIVATVSHDYKKINIPGYILRAIKLVSEGKKVVLFLDEYDKAREETDAFFLQLLQKGRINTTQHGDIEIPEKYKSNLQVIFCRNDMREELSGPLTRRLRLISLDYMAPDLFYKVAHRNLIEDAKKPVSEGLLNLVSLMYQAAYINRTIYNRLPAASEMMIAISDAHRLITLADAPQHIIYRILTKNMFKSSSDLITFESSVENGKTEEEQKIKDLIKDMKNGLEPTPSNLNHLISTKVLQDEEKELTNKIEEMNNLILEYKKKFEDMEEKRNVAIQEEIKKIKLAHGELVSTNNKPDVIRVFEDETSHIKRGMSIFDQSDKDWTDFASFYFNALSHHDFYEYLIKAAPQLDIIIFEDGILLENEEGVKFIMINDYDENANIRYRFLCNYPIIPPKFIKTLEIFVKTAIEIYKKQIEMGSKKVINANNTSACQVHINGLAYTGDESMYDITYKDLEDGTVFVENIIFLKPDDEINFIGTYPNINYDDLKEKAKSMMLERKKK